MELRISRRIITAILLLIFATPVFSEEEPENSFIQLEKYDTNPYESEDADMDGTIQVIGSIEERDDSYRPLTVEEEDNNIFLPETKILKNDIPSPKKDKETFAIQKEDGAESKALSEALGKDGRMSKVNQQSVGREVSEKPPFLDFQNYQTLMDSNAYRKAFISLSFMQDTYDYFDDENLFGETYRRKGSGKTSEFPGIIRVALTRFIYKGFVDVIAGGGIGIGYNAGKGVFSENGAQSDVVFKLWTIPADVVLGVELQVTRYVKLGLHGGPSLYGIIQNRNDKDPDTRDRNTRQYSPGYFLNGLVKVSLGDIFRSLGYSLFSEYNISKFYFHGEFRNHKYSNFKSKDLNVSGTSYGIGFTFEFF